ncbi:hypothetical protein BDZ91DRAFT_837263, partial [Kalaharituber pfeilii]
MSKNSRVKRSHANLSSDRNLLATADKRLHHQIILPRAASTFFQPLGDYVTADERLRGRALMLAGICRALARKRAIRGGQLAVGHRPHYGEISLAERHEMSPVHGTTRHTFEKRANRSFRLSTVGYSSKTVSYPDWATMGGGGGCTMSCAGVHEVLLCPFVLFLFSISFKPARMNVTMQHLPVF